MAERTTPRPEHFRKIPVVDLMENGQPETLSVFGSEGSELRLRAILAAASLFALIAVVLFNALHDRNLDAVADLVRQSANADSQVIEALEVIDQIAELQAIGDVSGTDLDFLLAEPETVASAIRSVFMLDVPGVIATKVEMLDTRSVAVELRVISNGAAIEWRGAIVEAEGVERVQSFDVVPGASALTYRATLVAGAGS